MLLVVSLARINKSVLILGVCCACDVEPFFPCFLGSTPNMIRLLHYCHVHFMVIRSHNPSGILLCLSKQ
ncbi:hypothetical protein PR202_ga09960 [Eleusine coracana subsp. coracana]|uniref:Secreted protein n=1 Tax=Eleusine coracana subsp. coracana TaxID=191504 RepID=A0AAV5C512_ELECO|nr:hypothetical protein PR202_ga09960 [Eleusine coracana subsp. coracana]